MTMIKKFVGLVEEFGIGFAIKYSFYWKTKNYDRYIPLVYNYLTDFFKEDIKKFNKKVHESPSNNNVEKFKVFVCWWQGYDKMPQLCKNCYERLKSVLSEEFELVFITKDNYMNYAELPNYIMQKFDKGYISITQFSDILREALIYQNGGIWIDSTVWTNEGINEYLKNIGDFWSIKLDGVYNPNMYGQVISKCQWSGFIIGGQKGSFVYQFVFECMCKYFKYHNVVIDYFIQNLLFKMAFELVEDCKRELKSVKKSNPHLYDLKANFNQPYDEAVFRKYNSDTSFFKLTYKYRYEEYLNGYPTFYKYIMDFNDLTSEE